MKAVGKLSVSFKQTDLFLWKKKLSCSNWGLLTTPSKVRGVDNVDNMRINLEEKCCFATIALMLTCSYNNSCAVDIDIMNILTKDLTRVILLYPMYLKFSFP